MASRRATVLGLGDRCPREGRAALPCVCGHMCAAGLARGMGRVFAGILVILGNPKAILFYIGILPGFFTVAALSPIDIAVIGGLSALVPFLGNLVLALMFDHVSKMLNSPHLRQRINRITGVVLICVGGLIFIS